MTKFIYGNKSIELDPINIESIYNNLIDWFISNNIILKSKNISLVTLGVDICHNLNDVKNSKTVLVVIKCINCYHHSIDTH